MRPSCFFFICILFGCAAGYHPTGRLNANVEPLKEGDWYRPALEIRWHLQLQGTVGNTYNVDLYDIDLFDTSSEFIEAIRKNDRKVFCYFSAGSAENWRPDFFQFDPGTMGAPLEGWPGEFWVDIRSGSVFRIMLSRLDLAVEKGCDGVDLDNVNGYLNPTGFPLTEVDQIAFNRNLANEAHRRGLAVILKNSGELAESLVDYFDVVLTESCFAFNECDAYRIFIENGKPVLHVEYAESLDEAVRLSRLICPESRQIGFDTLILNPMLDGSIRIGCD